MASVNVKAELAAQDEGGFGCWVKNLSSFLAIENVGEELSAHRLAGP